MWSDPAQSDADIWTYDEDGRLATRMQESDGYTYVIHVMRSTRMPRLWNTLWTRWIPMTRNPELHDSSYMRCPSQQQHSLRRLEGGEEPVIEEACGCRAPVLCRARRGRIRCRVGV